MCYSSQQSSKRTTSHIWQQHTEDFFFLCSEHITHLLQDFDFSVLGATFLRKCRLVSLGIVLLVACRPGTLCLPAACACFINTSSTNCILYDSCSILPSATCLQTAIELRTVDFSSLLKSLRYHLLIFFLSTMYIWSNWSFKSTPPMLWL